MANKKTIENLSKDYEVDNFMEYIIDSFINGQFKQVRELYNEMKPKDRQYFIHYFIKDYDLSNNAFDIVTVILGEQRV